MLGFQLREAFRGKRLKGMNADFKNQSGMGVSNIPASDFQTITSKSHDLLKIIETVLPKGAP